MRMNSSRVFAARHCSRLPSPREAGRGSGRGAALFCSLSACARRVVGSPRIARPPIGPLPKVVQKDGRHALMVDGAPFLVLGAQVNNSSAWPGVLPQVWPAIKAINANTVEMPVYWEQFEPKPGVFDYTVVDTLITQSRKNDVRLILLWFGTWKNGGPHYMPLWMKQEPAKYPRMVGANGRTVGSASPFSRETLEADKRAFVALMRHLKKFDAAAHGDHGAGRERARHLGRDPGLLAGGAEGVRQPGAGAGARRDEQEARQPRRAGWKDVFGKDADEYLPRVGRRRVHRRGRRGRARRSTRCRCTRTPRSAIRSRRARPAATRAAAPPTTCCRSGRPRRPRSTSWRPTST